MYSKEAISLVKDTIAAIKFLAAKARGEISQEEMISCAKQSIAKTERGDYQLVYSKDRRTIVAKPRAWEWVPEPGEWCLEKWPSPRLITKVRQQRNGNWLIMFFNEISSQEELATSVTPLIHWQRLVSIMLSLGFWLDVDWSNFTTVKIFKPKKKDPVFTKIYFDPQETVMLSITEFAKELNHAKK